MRSALAKVLGLVILGSAVTACGHGEEEWQGKLREITTLRTQLREMTTERDRLREQLESLRASNEAMARRLSELGENVNRLQADQARTESELSAAQAREAELRRRQQQQEARMATYRNMLAQFRSMITAGQLRVRVVRGRMVIELPAGILFDSGRAELRREGQDVLRQVATVLAQIPNRDFLVAGHTDNVQLGRNGRFDDNWDLSAARATNVVRFLAQNSVTSARLGAAGYAEFQPAQENDTDEHRALNRRVEIVLMPNIEELPDLSTLDGPASGTPAPAPAPAPR